MPINASKSSNFESRYGGGFISSSQYLSEMMCERQAARDSEELIQRFWNLPRWKREFKSQILAANGLLKLYDIKVLISVLKSKPQVYSLHAKWLDPLFQQAALNASQEKQFKEEKPKPIVSSQPSGAEASSRPTFKSKTSLLDALDAIENN